MTVIKKTTQRGENILRSWECGDAIRSLREVYGRYSYAKEKAFNDCFSMFANDSGARDFRCTGHSTFSFSVAWINSDGDLRYETSKGSYIVK